MFTGQQYWWVGLIMVFIYIGLIFLVRFLRNKPNVCYLICYIIAIYLIIFKVTENIWYFARGIYWNFPIEFSALSYWTFSILMLIRVRKADQYGAFCALLTGTIYIFSWVMSPNSHVNNFIQEDTNYIIATGAVVNHSCLFFAGWLMVFNCRDYSFKTVWQLFIGIACFVAYPWIIWTCTDFALYKEKPLIIQMCDSSIVSYIFSNPSTGLKIGYYFFALPLLFGIMALFYFINHIGAKYRKAHNIVLDYHPKKFVDIFKLNSSQNIVEG